MKSSLRKLVTLGLMIGSLGVGSSALAIPVLQVGAPASSSDSGTYADYIGALTSPSEEDTAVTSGNTLYVGGVYKSNVDLLGGKYGAGKDWSGFDRPTAFDGHGAILLATVANGSLGSGTLTVNGRGAFFTSLTNSYFPNNHAPTNGADYLFFDIGNFANTGSVPNFDTETGAENGEIKSLTIAISGYEWVHFDVMAIETDKYTKNTQIKYSTELENNPGSHDVTWKNNPPTSVPEPSTLLLLGSGLVSLGLFARRRKR